MTTISKPTDFVIECENTLGWTPPDDMPLWKARAIEAGKVNRKRKTNLKLYTWDNLMLAVEYCRRHQRSVRSPAAVLWLVERAVEDAYVPEPQRPITALIQAAIEAESMTRTMGHLPWLSRLTRANGDARIEVYDDWLGERGRLLAIPADRICSNCRHAQFGDLVRCTLFDFKIMDERASAADCDSFHRVSE